MSAITAPPDQAVEPDAPAPARPRRRRWLLLLVVVLAAAGTGGWLLLGPSAATEDAGPPSPPAEGAVVEVGTLTTNLAGSGGHFARVGLALVLAEGEDAAAVADRFALVKDAAIGELGQIEAGRLQAAGGSAVLRERLTAHADELYPDGEVLRVVLTEFLVQ